MRKHHLWGQHVDEYQAMFDLSFINPQKQVFEFGCGLSAVNAELNAASYPIVSCDPLFNLSKDELYRQNASLFPEVIAEFSESAKSLDFSKYGGKEAFITYRQQGLQTFFTDYQKGLQENRYIGFTRAKLPFADFNFDLALCYSYFFSDLEQHTVDNDLTLLKELTRVAKEVRIFPLIDKNHTLNPMLGPVLLAFQQQNYGIEIKEVPYHLETNGNVMLRIWAQACSI